MADNAQKFWMQKSLGGFVNSKQAALTQIDQKAMPCTVVSVNKSMVTVKFEVNSNYTLPNITIPQAMSDYARIPTQPGDKGYAVPNDYYLGGQSGQGGGTATLNSNANLSQLVFHHISQTSFSAVDPNAYVIHGPNGVVAQTTDGSVSMTLTPGGIAFKGNITVDGSITTTGSGGSMVSSGNISTTGNVTAGAGGTSSVELLHHTHGSGPPPDPGS